MMARITPDGSKAVVEDNTTQLFYVVDVASASLIRTIPTGGRIVYSLAVTAALSLNLGWVMHRFTNAAMPYADSAIAGASVAAQ